jgi:hypothetical protein
LDAPGRANLHGGSRHPRFGPTMKYAPDFSYKGEDKRRKAILKMLTFAQSHWVILTIAGWFIAFFGYVGLSQPLNILVLVTGLTIMLFSFVIGPKDWDD